MGNKQSKPLVPDPAAEARARQAEASMQAETERRLLEEETRNKADYVMGVEYVGGSELTYVGAPLQLRFTITNKSSVELAGGSLLVKADGVYEAVREIIQAWPTNAAAPVPNSCALQLTRRKKTEVGADVGQLDTHIHVELWGPNGNKLSAQSFLIPMNRFTAKFYDLNENANEVVDIQLFGPAGSTKSSLINSIFTLLDSNQDRIRTGVALSGGSETRVTTTLKAYRLQDLTAHKLTCIRLWDTWGFEVIKEGFDPSYTDTLYKAMLFGQLQNGFQKVQGHQVDVVLQNQGDTERDFARKTRRRAIIFMLPLNMMALMSGPAVDRAISAFNTATEAGVHSVLCLTMCDTEYPTFRTDGKIPPGLQEQLDAAAIRFRIHPSNVFPIVNYHNERSRTPIIERNILRMMERVLSIAKDATAVPDEDPDLVMPRSPSSSSR